MTLADAAANTAAELQAIHDYYEVDTLTPGDEGYEEAIGEVEALAQDFDIDIDEAWNWIAGANWGRTN